MNMRAAFILSGCIFLSSPVTAAPGPNYFGIAIGDANFKTNTNTEFSTTSFTFRYGINVLPFFGLEAQAAISSVEVFKDPEITYGGAFARLSIPTDRTRFYILAGLALVNYDFNTVVNGDIEQEVAGGIGVELYGNESTALIFEGMRYGESDELDVFSLGYIQRF